MKMQGLSLKITFQFLLLPVICTMAMLYSGCSSPEPSNPTNTAFHKENLVAWCIVPFDKLKRTPQQRVTMLKEMGIQNLAYDWRPEHLTTFSEEIQLLKENEIELKAVWLWINGNSSQLLDENNQKLFSLLEENQVRTDIWLSFNHNFFEGLSEEKILEKAVATVDSIQSLATNLGCKVVLYNHGEWFGNPLNQVKIIKALPNRDLSMVYNFHHAHHEIDAFPTLLSVMKPYLATINLNGMQVDGPKILPIGQGDRELEMIKAIIDIGFEGSIGILGHVEDEDVKLVLERNLEGLQKLLKTLSDRNASETYQILLR